jgi:prepilin-type N-terminal cleavage/methylation domain-containing protein
VADISAKQMKTFPHPMWKSRKEKWEGFTLVELLVSIVVFTLILTLFSRTTGFVAQAVTGYQKQINATQADRTVLDALENDLASAVTQKGMTVYISQDGQNNIQLAFLTQGRGPSSVNAADFRLMAVTYLLNGTQLTRQVTPVLWGDTNLTGIVIGTALSSTYSSSTTFSVLSNRILRLDAVVQLDDSSIASYSSNATWLNPVSGSSFSGLILSTSPINASSPPRVRSIIVAIAAVDGQILQLPGASTMGSKLGPPSPAYPTPLDYWQNQIESGVFNGFPKPAVAGLEFYQRICQLK